MDTFIHTDGIEKINAGKNVRFYPADIHVRILLSGFSQWGFQASLTPLGTAQS
jgi:hypothetical protein